MEEPKGWRELQQKALDETDPQCLIEIIDRMMSTLLANEAKVAAASAPKRTKQDPAARGIGR